MERPDRKDYEYSTGELKRPDYWEESLLKYIDYLESKDDWISVEDRLPEEEKGYSIFTHGNVFYGQFDVKHNLFMSAMGSPQKVTHWKPLPSPPKPNK